MATTVGEGRLRGRKRSTSRLGRAVVAGALVAPLGALGGVAQAAGPQVRVVATGLAAPKHLTVGPDGHVWAAVSGSGGGDCVTGPNPEGATTQYCAGSTASVIEVTAQGAKAVITGLPSVLEEDTQEPLGPAAVAFSCHRTALLFQDELVNKDGSNGLPGAAHLIFGHLLVRGGGNGYETSAFDLARFAATHPQNPETLGGVPGETTYDSDPYDVVAYRGGWAVADAAANALEYITRGGDVIRLAHFPTFPEQLTEGSHTVTIDAQAVPTSVAVGPDGALYVGLLRGVPSDPGTAEIYRVVPGHAPTVWARGLTAVTAIAWEGHRLLATELSVGGLLAAGHAPGALVSVTDGGAEVTTLYAGLNEPTGVAVGRHGTIYVANNGAELNPAEPGQILAITGV